MEKCLTVVINCGETTCYSKPGVHCQYLGSKRMGTIHVCMLFPDDDDSNTVLEDKDGWLQRCASCLRAEKLRLKVLKGNS